MSTVLDVPDLASADANGFVDGMEVDKRLDNALLRTHVQRSYSISTIVRRLDACKFLIHSHSVLACSLTPVPAAVSEGDCF